MGTLKQAVDRVVAAKTAIGNAISTKGGTVSAGDGLEDFAGDIATITNQYTAGDEGKVVSNGALVAQTAHATITTNNTYDTTLNNSVTVNVAGAAYSLLTPDSPSSFQYCYAYIINIDNRTIIVAQFKLTSSLSSISLSYDSTFEPAYTAASSASPSYAGRLSTSGQQGVTPTFDTDNHKVTLTLNTASSAGQLIVSVRGQ